MAANKAFVAKLEARMRDVIRDVASEEFAYTHTSIINDAVGKSVSSTICCIEER
jgi:hypothetical protein